MLNYPRVGKKPCLGDYQVSKLEIEKYEQAKANYEREKREREDKNNSSSCLLTFVIIIFIAIIIFSLIANANNSNPSNGQAFVIVLVIAACICPIIIGKVSKISEKAVDLATDSPYLQYSPNQDASKRYQEALDKYNKLTNELRHRYPRIEEVNYNEHAYNKLVINDLEEIIDKKLNYRNYVWWRNHSITFKTAVHSLLLTAGYHRPTNTKETSSAVTVNKQLDITLGKEGWMYYFKFYSKNSPPLEIKQIEAIQLAVPNEYKHKIIVVTNCHKVELSKEIVEYIADNGIELWDVKKLVELTRIYVLDKDKEEYPINLSHDFKKCVGFQLQPLESDYKLKIQPFFYYIYKPEIFNKVTDAFNLIDYLPRGKICYGICEYPNLKFLMYDDHEHKQRTVYYEGEKPSKPVYVVIAFTSEHIHSWRIKMECRYMYDASCNEYISNDPQLSYWKTTKERPFIFESSDWRKYSWE